MVARLHRETAAFRHCFDNVRVRKTTWERSEQIVISSSAGQSNDGRNAMPVILIGIWSLLGTASTYVLASAFHPEETPDVHVERKIAKSSTRWCPPVHRQTTITDYPQS
jgi:hypothetical protein